MKRDTTPQRLRRPPPNHAVLRHLQELVALLPCVIGCERCAVDGVECDCERRAIESREPPNRHV